MWEWPNAPVWYSTAYWFVADNASLIIPLGILAAIVLLLIRTVRTLAARNYQT